MADSRKGQPAARSFPCNAERAGGCDPPLRRTFCTHIYNLPSKEALIKSDAHEDGSFSVILHQKSLPCVSKPADFLYNLPKKSLVPSHTPI
ncbi:MAG: hypothetical protein IJT41_03985 [Clostridia bacterium]|nr:hypothetical protein [Clostridia bacterium]